MNIPPEVVNPKSREKLTEVYNLMEKLQISARAVQVVGPSGIIEMKVMLMDTEKYPVEVGTRGPVTPNEEVKQDA